MNDKNKTILTYGLYAALISVLFSVIVYVTDLIMLSLWSGLIIFFFNFLLTIFVLAFFGRKFRNTFSPDSFKYSSALKNAMIMVAAIAIIGFLYNFSFSSWIEPNYEERVTVAMADKVETMMIEQGVPQSKIDQTMDEMLKKPKTSPVKSAAHSIIWTLIMGFFSALIACAFVRKKSTDPFGEEMRNIDNE